jgi:hypothetical protein
LQVLSKSVMLRDGRARQLFVFLLVATMAIFGEMFVLAISEGSLHSWLLAVFFPLLCGLSGASVIVLTKRTKQGMTDEVETNHR